jgi:sugar phosphate isomerase/epimerase
MSASLDRRSVLTGLAAAGIAATACGRAVAATRQPFFERIRRPIGLQLYTLGEEAGKDLDRVFTRLVEIGYRDIELPELYGKNPADIKAAADRAGLTISCLHISAYQIAKNLSISSEPQSIADLLNTLGVFETVLPMSPMPPTFKMREGEHWRPAMVRAFAEAGADHWKRTAELLNERASALRPYGIRLSYHNHNVEFVPIGKSTGWEILADATDPTLVTFETDTGFLGAAGIDPVAFLQRYSGRIRLLHIKDIKPTTKINYALEMDSAVIGEGKFDWAKILPAADKAGVRYYYVEMEPPYGIPRMEAVARSFAYLARLRA